MAPYILIYICVIFNTVSFKPIQTLILYVASFAHNKTFFLQPSEETNPRHGRFVTANRPPSRNGFFNVYSSHSNKQEPDSFQITRRKEPSDESLAILQTNNSLCPVSKQWDQRVPSNLAGNCSAEGKENGVLSREGFSGSKCPLQTEMLRDTENKRSTSQILALFSSRTNTPLPTMEIEERQ